MDDVSDLAVLSRQFKPSCKEPIQMWNIIKIIPMTRQDATIQTKLEIKVHREIYDASRNKY